MGLSPRVESEDTNMKLEVKGKKHRVDQNGNIIKDNMIMKFFESGSIEKPMFSLYFGN